MKATKTKNGYTYDLWQRSTTQNKVIRNKLSDKSFKPYGNGDRDTADLVNRPRFLKSNPKKYVPNFGDAQQAVIDKHHVPTNNKKQPHSDSASEYMEIINSNLDEDELNLIYHEIIKMKPTDLMMMKKALLKDGSINSIHLLNKINPKAELPKSKSSRELTPDEMVLRNLVGDVIKSTKKKHSISNKDIEDETPVKSEFFKRFNLNEKTPKDMKQRNTDRAVERGLKYINPYSKQIADEAKIKHDKKYKSSKDFYDYLLRMKKEEKQDKDKRMEDLINKGDTDTFEFESVNPVKRNELRKKRFDENVSQSIQNWSKLNTIGLKQLKKQNKKNKQYNKEAKEFNTELYDNDDWLTLHILKELAKTYGYTVKTTDRKLLVKNIVQKQITGRTRSVERERNTEFIRKELYPKISKNQQSKKIRGEKNQIYTGMGYK